MQISHMNKVVSIRSYTCSQEAGGHSSRDHWIYIWRGRANKPNDPARFDVKQWTKNPLPGNSTRHQRKRNAFVHADDNRCALHRWNALHSCDYSVQHEPDSRWVITMLRVVCTGQRFLCDRDWSLGETEVVQLAEPSQVTCHMRFGGPSSLIHMNGHSPSTAKMALACQGQA